MPKAGSARTWLSLIAFVGIVALMDYMLLDYLTSHGLELKLQPIQVGSSQFSFPIVGLTFVGLLIVAIAGWGNMAGSMPITALREMSFLENVRMLRVAAVSLFFFSLMLFGPYVIGANIFFSQMASLSRSVPQLAGSLQGLYQFSEPMMNWDALTKLAVSQNLAALTLVVVSWWVGHSQRRIRRTR